MIQLVDLALDKKLERDMQKAISRVLLSKQYIMGNELSRFEKEFATFLGAKFAVGVANGTDALRLALRALGVGKGDKVLTVSFTSPFTAIAIIEEGAIPVFCDINAKTLTIDIDDLRKKVRGAKAIIPVHLYGNPANIDEILQIAKIYGLKVIEDACQAHGARIGKNKIGTFGDASAFSFYPTKNLGGVGDGGMVVTNDPRLAKKIRLLRHGGQTKRFWHEYPGINSRLDEIQAAILRIKLKRLNIENKKRKILAANYRRKLTNLPIRFQEVCKNAESVNHLFIIRTKSRKSLQEFLIKEGVLCDIYYPFPVHRQPSFKKYSNGILLETEKASREILAIPISPSLTFKEQDFIIKKINYFFANQEKKILR